MSLFNIVSQMQGYRVAINGRRLSREQGCGLHWQQQRPALSTKEQNLQLHRGSGAAYQNFVPVTKYLYFNPTPSLDLRGLGAVTLLSLLHTSFTPDTSLGHITALRY